MAAPSSVRIGSFDLGKVNFAYAVLSAAAPPSGSARSVVGTCEAVTAHTETEVVCWDRVSICDSAASVEQYVGALMAHMQALWVPLFRGLDVVVIEQQLRQNTCMKCGAHALQGLFAFHGTRVLMMPPRHKFRGFRCAAAGLKSRELKRLSVQTASEWAVQYQGRCAPEARAAFDQLLTSPGAHKLDDLSDAMLQALSALYAAFHPPQHRPPHPPQ